MDYISQMFSKESSARQTGVPSVRSNLVGGLTLRGVIRKARSSGYTLRKAIGDIADGGITMLGTSKLSINIQKSDLTNKVLRITISDNNDRGMYKLVNTGEEHPLCWTHKTTDHEDDNNISEYGSGLKAAACNLAGKLEIITAYNEGSSEQYTHKHLLCHWKKMSDANTFDPDEVPINSDRYNHLHPFTKGTSFILTDIDTSVVHGNSENDIKNYIQTIYWKYILDGLEVCINGVKLEASVPPTEAENPWPIYRFTIENLFNSVTNESIYIYKDDSKDDSKSRWHVCKLDEYSKVTANAPSSENFAKEYSEVNGWKTNFDMSFKGCKCHGVANDPQNKNGSVVMARNNRILTDGEQFVGFGQRPTNGENNHNYFKLDWSSKIVNKELRISYSKAISVPLPINYLTSVLDYVYKKLKSMCKSNTSHNKMWVSKYNIPWDSKSNYSENLVKATAINTAVSISRNASIDAQRFVDNIPPIEPTPIEPTPKEPTPVEPAPTRTDRTDRDLLVDEVKHLLRGHRTNCGDYSEDILKKMKRDLAQYQ